MKNANENELFCNISGTALCQTVHLYVVFDKGLCLKYYKIIHFHSRFSHHRGKKVMLFGNLIFTVIMFLAAALRSLKINIVWMTVPWQKSPWK